MKYTVLGFQQSKLIELGLDTDDALILSVIRDMYSSKAVEYKIINNDRFIWINQTYLLNQVPIIGSKRFLQKRIKLYEDLNLIERRVTTEKDGLKGKFSYINTTKLLDELSDYVVDEFGSQGYAQNSQGLRTNDVRVTHDIRIKDSSIKDSSIKDIDIYSRVIDHLNKKANTAFRATTKKTQQTIRARINEGFKEEDFYTVIDKKVSEWLNDEKMCKFLRPETLFGTKFESYLNQKVGGPNGANGVYSSRQNIKTSGNNGNKSYFSKCELTEEERRAAEAELL